MKIEFSKHAELKFTDLEKQSFKISKEEVEDTVNRPERINQGRKGRLIAQRPIDETHLVRVIYEQEQDSIKVITFYPARRQRYED